MPTAFSTLLERPSVRRWGSFAIKAVILLGVLLLIGRTAPLMPPACVAVLWAAASAVSALGVAYQVVIRKTLWRHKYQAGGALARLNEGRALSLVVGFALSAVCVAAFVLDGKYYDYQAVEALIEETRQKSETLTAEAREVLVPLINESYDARLANVDSYLDWYYSLPADYERLAHMITGSVEDFVAEQFEAKIEEGIDDSAIAEELSSFSAQVEQLEADAMEKLESYELSGVPTWLIETKDALEADFLSEPLEPTHKLTDAGVRLGVSAAGGVAAGVLAKQLVTKIVEKQFFKTFVSKIAGAVGSRAAGGAVGGVVGSLVGPVGTVVGIVTGTTIGVGVDYLLLNIDEAQNRESYKAEMVEAIEEERAAMLALVQ